MKKICTTLSLFLLIAWQPGPGKQEKEAQTIRTYRDLFNQAIERHDLDAMTQFWREDITLVRGNATQTQGKDAVTAAWKKLFDENKEVNYVRTPSSIIISNNDTLAWETGTWKAFHSYSKGGNYSAMWRKTDKVWKLQAELFVSLK